MKQCEICGSTNNVSGKNGKYGMDLCGKHREQMSKYGYILERTQYDKNEFIIKDNVLKIILYDKHGEIVGYALTDSIYFDKVSKYKWSLDVRGYVASRINGKTTRLHRFILNPPKRVVVDHINRIKTDCRLENMKICSQMENMHNQNIRQNNSSGETGVYWYKRDKKWYASISINSKLKFLGSFNNIEDAIYARKIAENNYYGRVI